MSRPTTSRRTRTTKTDCHTSLSGDQSTRLLAPPWRWTEESDWRSQPLPHADTPKSRCRLDVV